MDTDQLFQEVINKLPKDKIHRFRQFSNDLKERYQNEISKPPAIAIIGRTGVGKSSTINALFGTKLPVSDSLATTKEPIEVPIHGQEIAGKRGSLIIYDMPGLGEDINADEVYKEMYRNIIKKCDVAVWVLTTDRDIAYDQMMIRDVVAPSNSDLISRIVIGMNKADLIEPNNWNPTINLPSKEQKDNLEVRMSDVYNKLISVCPDLTPERVIGFSAKKRYRLQHLFGAMLEACSPRRAWVLSSRQHIANYLELVDPKLQQKIRSKLRGTYE